MTTLAKPKRRSSPKLLAEVTRQPCLACGRTPSDPHHVTTRKAGGEDTPENVMPLCRAHHTEWHASGPGRMTEKYARVLKWLQDHGRSDIMERVKRTAR